MSSFKFFLFGSPRLERDGVAVKISRRKALALLCYLVATGKPHGRDILAALFWPDSGQSEARVALSRHLSYLNKTLGQGALVLEPERVAVGGDFWLDVAEFAAVLAAYPLVTADNLPIVLAAIVLYDADFLAGFTLPDCPDFDDWQAFQAESLRRSLCAALDKVALAQAALHDHERAIATARRRLAIDVLDEAAYRTLMQLYAQSGEQATALRQYEQCRQILQDELGAPPTEETTQLYERIRRGDRTSTLTAEPATVLADPIVDRKSQNANLHNLPAQTTPFVGRERELATVTRLLASADVRLLTITGQGGMGKTRLARQSGRRLLEHFPDGVWYLSVANVDQNTFGPALNPLLNGLAGVFGLKLRSADTAEAQILAYLHERRLLLILDNLEHLLESSIVISALLSGAAGIAVLATSRERLNLQEEWLFPLQGLTLPPLEAEEADASANAESWQLFVQVVQRVQPAFDAQAHGRAIARICRLVEGMPLGIELAASWVRYRTPAAIAQEIESNIDFLTTNLRNLPTRHRSLRAVFDHSWRLLSPQEEAILPQLAVFRGGFGLREVQAATGASQMVLAALVDKSILAVSTDGRYNLHERLRQYLLERLRNDLSVYQAVNERHSQVYLALLQQDTSEFVRPTTLQQVTEDFDNIIAAWHWAVDHSNWSAIRQARLGLHIFCLYKSWFLVENDFYERTIGLLKHRLAQPGLLPEQENEMSLLLAALQCDHIEVQGRLVIHDPARQPLLHENLNRLRALGPIAFPELANVLARATVNSFSRRLASYKAEWRYGNEALALFQSVHDDFGQWQALRSLGHFFLLAGEFEKAKGYGDRLLALAEHAPYVVGAGLALHGLVATAQGGYAQARTLFWQSYEWAVGFGPDFPAIPFFLADLANVARLQGDTSQATAYLQRTATIERPFRQGRDGLRYLRHHKVLLAAGLLAATKGDLTAAQDAFVEIWQQDQGQSHFSPAALIGLGWVALQQEDYAGARSRFASALPFTVQLETAPQALEALTGVAYLQLQAGQWKEALTLIGLVRHHPSTYQETKDRLLNVEAAARAALSLNEAESALASGQMRELWSSVAAVLAVNR